MGRARAEPFVPAEPGTPGAALPPAKHVLGRVDHRLVAGGAGRSGGSFSRCKNCTGAGPNPHRSQRRRINDKPQGPVVLSKTRGLESQRRLSAISSCSCWLSSQKVVRLMGVSCSKQNSKKFCGPIITLQSAQPGRKFHTVAGPPCLSDTTWQSCIVGNLAPPKTTSFAPLGAAQAWPPDSFMSSSHICPEGR